MQLYNQEKKSLNYCGITFVFDDAKRDKNNKDFRPKK